MFSGGVDSSLIALVCKKLKKDFICYSVGVSNAADIEAAEKVADFLKLKLKKIIINEKTAENIIKDVVNVLEEPDVVKVGVASVFYTALRQSKDRNILFKSRPLNTNFFLNTLAKNELANKRINKRLEKALILEKVGRSALYIAKNKNSFTTCFRDISETIIKPALQKLPEEQSVREKINEGLSEYRDY